LVTVRIHEGASGDEVKGRYLAALANEIREELGSLHCRSHGLAPTIVVGGSSPLRVDFQVDACCPVFQQLVLQKLREID
jgi:hypothetical protein